MEQSSFSLKVKGGVDDDGKFSGLLASFNTVDLGGDKIMPGAFTKTLAGGRTFPLLWQHDPAQPIGSFKATETSAGLQIDGELILTIQTAANARELLRRGVIKGLSIGYDTLKSDFVGDVRELTEIRLHEGSIVTFPMNPAATVTSVKSMSDEERAKHFKAIDIHRKAIDKHQRAQRDHLKALYDGIDDDESVEAQTLQDDESMDQDSAKAFASEFRKMLEMVRA